MNTLIPGQRVALSGLNPGNPLSVRLRLQGTAQALSHGVIFTPLCLLVDAQQKLASPQHLLGLKETQSPCHSVTQLVQDAESLEYRIDFEKLPASIDKIVLALVLADTGALPAHAGLMIESGQLQLASQDRLLAQLDFTGAQFDKERALILGEFYRKDGWRFLASCSGFIEGMDGLARLYQLPPQALRPAGALPSGQLPSLPSQRPGFAGYGPKPGTGPSPEGFEAVPLPRAWPGRTQPSPPASLVPAVGLIVGQSPQEGYFTGTGFIVTPGGHMLTCEHLVRGATELAFRAEGTQHTRPLIVLASDPATDTALLWLADGLGACDWLLLASPEDNPALGDAVGLLSYPLGVSLGDSVTYSQGIINSLRTWDNHRVLQADSGSAPGSSGAPLFRRSDGRVIGIHKSSLNSQEAILVKFATDIRELYQLGWLQPHTSPLPPA